MRNYLGLLLAALASFGFSSCKSLNQDASELATLPPICKNPVSLQLYLEPQISCTDDKLYLSPADARKRHLSAWIPCNDVEWVDDTLDLFGAGSSDSGTALDQSTYTRIHRDWLGTADRFTPALATQAFTDLGQPFIPSHGNPILETAMARSIKDLIRGAQHNIVMDIFLIGGSWGADILRDLAEAAERGVKVVLLHDNVSKFSVGNEMDPLWQEALKYSLKSPNFTAIASNIHPPARVSSLPFGLEHITRMITGQMDLTVSAEGKSDHAKVLIVDALYETSPDEYLALQPRMMVSSHNMVDSAASFYHDEAVIVKGPAAVIGLLSFQSDIVWALEQAKNTTAQLLNVADQTLVEDVLRKMDRLRITPVMIKSQGRIQVQPLQISANDEVRNLDTGIISKIMAAEHSIDIYDRIAYNWPLAIALKEAMARGVKVRIILDQQDSKGALGNAVLPAMMMLAPRRIAGGRTTIDVIDDRGLLLKEADLPVHWFLPIRPGKNFASKDRSNLAQEIHAKTIIIDSRLALFGSANLDSLSWAGGFREYSVWVDDPALAAESARAFDRLWKHPLLSVSHKVWLGFEDPAPAVVQYLQAKQAAAGCNPADELCDFTKILQGGKNFPKRGPKRELVRRILANEAQRIRAATPAKILQDANGRPLCKTL